MLELATLAQAVTFVLIVAGLIFLAEKKRLFRVARKIQAVARRVSRSVAKESQRIARKFSSPLA